MSPKGSRRPPVKFPALICLQNKTPMSFLSGPVLRDTARLSQRYPPFARYGVLGVSTWPLGCDTPSPFSEHLESMRDGGAIPPLKRGISAILARYPMKTRQNACNTPLCDTISKGYCAIWGGISHWAAKRASVGSARARHFWPYWGLRRSSSFLTFLSYLGHLIGWERREESENSREEEAEKQEELSKTLSSSTLRSSSSRKKKWPRTQLAARCQV